MLVAVALLSVTGLDIVPLAIILVLSGRLLASISVVMSRCCPGSVP